MKTITSILLLAVWLVSVPLTGGIRPESEPAPAPDSLSNLLLAQLNDSSKGKPTSPISKGAGNNAGAGRFFGPGYGFGIPGLGDWWGLGNWYGGGSGGPSGGHSVGGVSRPTEVCKEKGPCYNKKLRCPAKCFTSYSPSGKHYGGGSGGGGCTMDCKKKCIAYC